MSEKQIAFVTGADSGIGLATARKYILAGHKTALVSRHLDKLQDAVKDLQDQYGDNILLIAADISDSTEIADAVNKTVDRFGGLDVAVNSAGTAGNFKPMADLTDEDFNHVIDVDLRGTFYSMRAELKYFKQVGHGSIVNVSAEGSIMASPTMSAYISAKAGMNGLTRGAAMDYVKDNIRVNAVAPGATYTNMTADTIDNTDFGKYIKRVIPMGRVAKADEIADTIIFIGSDKSSFTSGQIIAVDGAQSVGLA